MNKLMVSIRTIKRTMKKQAVWLLVVLMMALLALVVVRNKPCPPLGWPGGPHPCMFDITPLPEPTQTPTPWPYP